MSTNLIKSGKFSSAFSILEALVVILVLGIVASVAVPFLGKVSESVDHQKLESDVEAINSALGTYITNGGDLGGVTDPQTILDKLKTRLTADNAKAYVGYTGSMIDPRMAVNLMPDSEVAGSEPRAQWDPAKSRFVVGNSGPGVKSFFYDDALAEVDYGTEARLASTFDYNKEEGWVWTYRDRTPDSWSGPTVVDTTDIPDDPPPPPTAEPAPLLPPTITPPGKGYAADKFPLPVTLHNPNPPSTWIMASLNGGPFQEYTKPFRVDPGNTLVAYTDGDPALWKKSTSINHNFFALAPPVQLQTPAIQLSAGGFDENITSITVTITNPNPPGSSELRYKVISPGGNYPGVNSWNTYSGSFVVSDADYPSGFEVKAYAQSFSPLEYIDSDFVEAQAGVLYFGVPLVGDVLFVLDASSSMNADFGGQSRYEAVIDETVAAIGRLPQNVRFNVSMFDAKVHWTDGTFELHRANPDNKSSLISQIQAVDNDSGTNYQAGLSLPPQYGPLPEMVIFLTDGGADSDWPYQAEVDQLAALGIKVHCLGLGLDSDDLQNLQEIATATGGSVSEIPEP